MSQSFRLHLAYGAVFLLLCSLAAGCGDGTSAASPSELFPALLEGMQVRLSRRASHCDRPSFDGLVAEVDANMEFPAEAVKSLPPPCPDSTHPGVEIYLAGNSLILDFRQIESPARFAEAQFNGYDVTLVRSCGDPVIAVATLDSDSSNLDIRPRRVESAFDRIEINLSGVAFDADSFLEIDLEVASINCING